MKYSIRKQFASVLCAFIIGTILLCLFINNTFLEKYYLSEKQKVLTGAYHEMNRGADYKGDQKEEFWAQFHTLCEKSNITYLLLDSNTRALRTSAHDYESLTRHLLNSLFVQEKSGKNTVIESGNDYEIRIFEDETSHSEFVEMWGVLKDGNLFLLRSPIESIKESVKLANRFLAYVGSCAVVLSVIISFFVSRKITRPIMELTSISEKMIHLDFDAKYTGNSKTEIALLGKNINELSYTLEKTISELKSANNELLRDIETKTKIDEMRTEFLSGVSHELKTPIALIQGYAEGLKEGITDDEESRDYYLDVIMDEAAKMNTMVKKLLTLNQLEFGSDAVTMERFDMVALIKNYLHASEVLCKQKDVRVMMEEYPPIYVWADEYQVEEVFGNYFTNALNHVAGEGVIDVKCIKNGITLRVSVFNTGSPIPEESLPHLWDKFYKVDKARTREYGGSGVGLSIVKAIMEAMNQKYGVNNYDNGVEFWFELEMTGE